MIDFEYGSYNYRGFDIGNHFNEYAGYDCDYTLYVQLQFRLVSIVYNNFLLKDWNITSSSWFLCSYPTKEEQYHFIKHYLQPDKPDEVRISGGLNNSLGPNRLIVSVHMPRLFLCICFFFFWRLKLANSQCFFFL